MEKDKISVIIPSYNSEKFLKHTVASVITQTYQNWELLIIDDASTDNSYQEALKYTSDSRVKVIKAAQNGGVGCCRNLGIKNAEGSYIAFLDSDDLWAKDKLAKQLSFMQKNDAAISHTAYAFMSEKGEVLTKGKVEVDNRVNLEHYMKTTQVGMSTVMYNREKLPNLKFPEDRDLCEDARAWFEVFHQGKDFRGLNDILMLYRVRSQQLSCNKANMAKNTLKRYIKEDNLPAYKRLYCFLHYAYNGTKKRLNPTNLDEKILENFNCNKKANT